MLYLFHSNHHDITVVVSAQSQPAAERAVEEALASHEILDEDPTGLTYPIDPEPPTVIYHED